MIKVRQEISNYWITWSSFHSFHIKCFSVWWNRLSLIWVDHVSNQSLMPSNKVALFSTGYKENLSFFSLSGPRWYNLEGYQKLPETISWLTRRNLVAMVFGSSPHIAIHFLTCQPSQNTVHLWAYCYLHQCCFNYYNYHVLRIVCNEIMHSQHDVYWIWIDHEISTESREVYMGPWVHFPP